MDKRLLALLLVFAADMMLLSGAAPVSADEKHSSGRFMEYSQILFEKGRYECIQSVARFLEQAEINDQVLALLERAREHYYKNVEPGYVSPLNPAYCNGLNKYFDKDAKETRCLQDPSIVGKDERLNVAALIRASEKAKLLIEAKYACAHERNAGKYLREKGLFDEFASKA